MSTDEKAAAFDLLREVLTNRWSDGTWSWWNPTPCGGDPKATREEAAADLLVWAERVLPLVRKKHGRVQP